MFVVVVVVVVVVTAVIVIGCRAVTTSLLIATIDVVIRVGSVVTIFFFPMRIIITFIFVVVAALAGLINDHQFQKRLRLVHPSKKDGTHDIMAHHTQPHRQEKHTEGRCIERGTPLEAEKYLECALRCAYLR